MQTCTHPPFLIPSEVDALCSLTKEVMVDDRLVTMQVDPLSLVA